MLQSEDYVYETPKKYLEKKANIQLGGDSKKKTKKKEGKGSTQNGA
jgi:hypothetical protein